MMNEMIKKNEVKIKTSNKRLFSEISSHSVMPTSSIITSVVSSNNRPSLSNEDETDGRAKLSRINSFGSSYTAQNLTSGNSTNYLSKIVGSKLGSTSNTNLVTLVVGAPTSNSLTMDSGFARLLQSIQSERANVK